MVDSDHSNPNGALYTRHHSPRGILRTPNVSEQDQKPLPAVPASTNIASHRRLQWDEEALAQSESEKCSTMKIDEPKTPFIHGLSFDEEEDGTGASIGTSVPPRMPQLDLQATNPTGFIIGSSNSSLACSVSSIGSASSHEWDTSEDEGNTMDELAVRSSKNPHDVVMEPERHARFEELRKKHYHMREALKKGRELLKSDKDPDDDPTSLGK